MLSICCGFGGVESGSQGGGREAQNLPGTAFSTTATYKINSIPEPARRRYIKCD
jgi:hypothetical protein